jgi:hypothetical protein
MGKKAVGYDDAIGGGRVLLSQRATHHGLCTQPVGIGWLRLGRI